MWHLGRCFGCSWGWGAGCFLFSSRRRHTRCGRDWSSHVCSSDLVEDELGQQEILKDAVVMYPNPADHIFYITNSSSIVLTELVMYDVAGKIVNKVDLSQMVRSEERRVGKVCGSRVRVCSLCDVG